MTSQYTRSAVHNVHKDPYELFDDWMQSKTERAAQYERLGDTARFTASEDLTYEELSKFVNDFAQEHNGRVRTVVLYHDRSAVVVVSCLNSSFRMRRGLHRRRGTGLPKRM